MLNDIEIRTFEIVYGSNPKFNNYWYDWFNKKLEKGHKIIPTECKSFILHLTPLLIENGIPKNIDCLIQAYNYAFWYISGVELIIDKEELIKKRWFRV